jgi:hypothetical protein
LEEYINTNSINPVWDGETLPSPKGDVGKDHKTNLWLVFRSEKLRSLLPGEVVSV